MIYNNRILDLKQFGDYHLEYPVNTFFLSLNNGVLYSIGIQQISLGLIIKGNQ